MLILKYLEKELYFVRYRYLVILITGLKELTYGCTIHIFFFLISTAIPTSLFLVTIYQFCGSASMGIRIRIQGAKQIRIRILVRQLSHKKLNFYMKNKGTGTVLLAGTVIGQKT
jgi:hypothetical protein